ncbi:hypothetical protein ISS08_02000 [Candidatus Pacearchaeota archaeon]|nr:hypothetical protein [Candidatus Pacearchaeota archaeon]
MTENQYKIDQASHSGLLVRKTTSGTSAPIYNVFEIQRAKNVPIPMDENTVYSVYSFDATKKLSATQSIVDHTNIGFFSESEMINSLSNLFGMRITKPNELEMEVAN